MTIFYDNVLVVVQSVFRSLTPHEYSTFKKQFLLTIMFSLAIPFMLLLWILRILVDWVHSLAQLVVCSLLFAYGVPLLIRIYAELFKEERNKNHARNHARNPDKETVTDKETVDRSLKNEVLIRELKNEVVDITLERKKESRFQDSLTYTTIQEVYDKLRLALHESKDGLFQTTLNILSTQELQLKSQFILGNFLLRSKRMGTAEERNTFFSKFSLTNLTTLLGFRIHVNSRNELSGAVGKFLSFQSSKDAQFSTDDMRRNLGRIMKYFEAFVNPTLSCPAIAGEMFCPERNTCPFSHEAEGTLLEGNYGNVVVERNGNVVRGRWIQQDQEDFSGMVTGGCFGFMDFPDGMYYWSYDPTTEKIQFQGSICWRKKPKEQKTIAEQKPELEDNAEESAEESDAMDVTEYENDGDD